MTLLTIHQLVVRNTTAEISIKESICPPEALVCPHSARFPGRSLAFCCWGPCTHPFCSMHQADNIPTNFVPFEIYALGQRSTASSSGRQHIIRWRALELFYMTAP